MLAMMETVATSAKTTQSGLGQRFFSIETLDENLRRCLCDDLLVRLRNLNIPTSVVNRPALQLIGLIKNPDWQYRFMTHKSQFLFATQAKRLVQESFIEPALLRGEVVIAGGSWDELAAYGKGPCELPPSEVDTMISFFSARLEPRTTFFVAVEPAVAYKNNRGFYLPMTESWYYEGDEESYRLMEIGYRRHFRSVGRDRLIFVEGRDFEYDDLLGLIFTELLASVAPDWRTQYPHLEVERDVN